MTPASTDASSGRHRARLTPSRLAAIGLGGMTGACLRWWVLGVWPVAGAGFPWPVLTINVAGSFILGLALAEEWDHPQGRLVLHDGLGIGFCGGLTTFSTFAVEVSNLTKSGGSATATAYVSLSVLLAAAGVFAGAAVLRRSRAVTMLVETDELGELD